MKLRVKLRITSAFTVIVGLIYISAKFFQIQQRSILNYRQELSQQIFHTLGSRNASQFFKVNVDSTFLQPKFGNSDNTERFFTVAIVMTIAENRDWRRTIRETWAKWADDTNSVVLFFMCKPHNMELIEDLQQELLLYNDIIIDNLMEDPLMSSVKSLKLLNWYQMNFGESSEFLIKTDDNVFINLFNLNNHLDTLTSLDIFNGYIGGKVNEKDDARTPSFDDPYSPRFVPQELWDGGLYPEFISSSFVVISQRMIPYILNVTNNILLFHIEPVYLTGMLVKWTLRLDLSEIPGSYDEYSLGLDYTLWWTGEFKDIIAFQCNNRWRMMNLFSKTPQGSKRSNKIDSK